MVVLVFASASGAAGGLVDAESLMLLQVADCRLQNWWRSIFEYDFSSLFVIVDSAEWRGTAPVQTAVPNAERAYSR